MILQKRLSDKNDMDVQFDFTHCEAVIVELFTDAKWRPLSVGFVQIFGFIYPSAQGRSRTFAYKFHQQLRKTLEHLVGYVKLFMCISLDNSI